MSDRLPQPLILIEFEGRPALPDCLRAALNHARRLQLGLCFVYGPDETLFTIQPWMTLEDVLALCEAPPVPLEVPAAVYVSPYRAVHRVQAYHAGSEGEEDDG